MNRFVNLLFNIFSVFSLITGGLIGFIIFDGIIEEGIVEATTIIVDSNGGGNHISIQSAINASKNGDTIYVWAGTYNENLNISRQISLIGNGTSNTTINGSGIKDVVRITADSVNISGFLIINSGMGPSAYAGIICEGVSNCSIFNNNISNNRKGLSLMDSENNIIYRNKIGTNKDSGIILRNSVNNTIKGNIINANQAYGIILYKSSSNNKLINNNFSNNYHGIDNREFSHNTSMINNNVTKNLRGIVIGDSSNIDIIDNFVSSNDKQGITLGTSSNNNIRNNVFINNIYGIILAGSKNNNITNNKFTHEGIYIVGAIGVGIAAYNSHRISLTNLINGKPIYYLKNDDNVTIENVPIGQLILANCSKINVRSLYITNTTVGMLIVHSKYINITNNYISNNNLWGIFLCFSNNSIITENSITENGLGVFIQVSSKNKIYHNYFINNTDQASDSGSMNYWDDGYPSGGNYWSDYSGLDDGSNGRIANDGIGDTKIPHLNLDNQPYVTKYGWNYIGTPVINNLGGLCTDGIYSISWSLTARASGYILEEDISSFFNSPEIIYNGDQLKFDISKSTNNTYYYRVRAYDNELQSNWSNVVEMIVDYPPAAPTGLIAKDIGGHEIILSWDPNSEQDLDGYYIFMNNTNKGSTGPFHLIKIVTNSTTQYKVTNLTEETKYYFMISAFDKNSINSTNSDVANAITLDITPPEVPKGLTAMASSNSEIKLNWNPSNDQDLIGYLIYMNNTDNNQNEDYHLINKIIGNTNTNIVSGLSERITYYFKIKSFDEVPNNSSFSNIAPATTPDETPPSAPTGLNIIKSTSRSLTVAWKPNPEPDLVGYRIYRSLIPDQYYIPLNIEIIITTEFIDTGLNEATSYYYKIIAVDTANLTSDFSNIASGTTLLKSLPPQMNNSMSDFNITEDSYDDTSINLLKWFNDPNNDILKFWCEGQNNLTVTIFQSNGTVVLQPKHNWNGKEKITFFASDEVSGNISDSVTVTVTAINDPPGPAKIIYPSNNSEISYNYPIDFKVSCPDPDLIYGDELLYIWISSISKEIGNEMILKGIKLSKGIHIITIEVTDKNGMTSTDLIVINVTVGIEIDTDRDGIPDLWEERNGLNSSDHSDANKDFDEDGLSNLEEYHLGTEPWKFDTDDDGYGDRKDEYPLDPSKWEKETKSSEVNGINRINILILVVVVLLIVTLIYLILKKKVIKKEEIEQNKNNDFEKTTELYSAIESTSHLPDTSKSLEQLKPEMKTESTPVLKPIEVSKPELPQSTGEISSKKIELLKSQPGTHDDSIETIKVDKQQTIQSSKEDNEEVNESNSD